MDTLPCDLLNLVSNHYDVLPIVFLTNKQLELEDDNASVYRHPTSHPEGVYQKENWPWILYKLKSKIYDWSNLMDWIVKNNYINILNLVHLDDQGIISLYLLAHSYSRLDLIDKYKDKIKNMYAHDHAILYAASGGQAELLFKLLKDKRQISIASVYDNLFFNGHLSIINDPRMKLFEHFSPYRAICRATEGEQLEILIDLLSKYEYTLPTGFYSDIDIGSKTFRTITYMIDHGYSFFTDDIITDVELFTDRLILNNGSLELLSWLVDRYGFIKINRDMVSASFDNGCLEYLKILLKDKNMPDNEVLKYIFENFDVRIFNDYDVIEDDENHIIFNIARQSDLGHRKLVYAINKYLNTK